jgi:hypothetical protein
MKCYLRNAVINVFSQLRPIFYVLPLIIISLSADPIYPSSEAPGGDHSESFRWSHRVVGGSPDLDVWLDNLDPEILITQSEYPIKDEHPFGADETPPEKRPPAEPITRALPFGGEKVRAMGYDLPLPFGIGANFVYVDQGIEIRNLKVDIGDTNIDASGISFSDANAHDAAGIARLDLWLLPFANVYGIIGYLNGEAELDVNIPALTVNLPIIGPVPITQPQTLDFNIDYNGVTYGGGATLAGGYKNVFASLDINYTETNVDIVDGDIDTLTISPRLGILVDPDALAGTLAFWIGAMYMDYRQTVTDDINLRELDPRLPSVELDFEIDIKNETPWNFLFGGQWEITKRFQLTAEGGLGNRKQVILGGFFRF